MQEKKSLTKSQMYIYILVTAGIIALVNFISTKAFKRLDLTENKQYSLSPATKDMLGGLDDIINIKAYFSKDLPPQLQTTVSDIRDMLTEFKTYAGKKLIVTEIDPSGDEELKRKIRQMGIPEVQVQSFEKDKAQTMLCFMGIAVFFADNKEVLPVVRDVSNLEYKLAHAIMKVSRQDEPVVGILKTDTMPYMDEEIRRQMRGQIPEDPTEEKYRPVFEKLKETYEVKTVDISDSKKVDPDIVTLIIPGGDENSFTENDLYDIDQYFMKGGNLIVMSDGIKLTQQYGMRGSPMNSRIHDLLSHYGVKVEQSVVADASCGKVQIPQQWGNIRIPVAVDYPFFVRINQNGFDEDNPAVAGVGQVILPWPSPLSLFLDSEKPDAVNADILAVSSEKSWTVSNNINLTPNQEWGEIIRSKGEDLKKHNLVVHLNGSFTSYFKDEKSLDNQNDENIVNENSDAHLVVIGNSHFVSRENANNTNLALIVNLVDWLSLNKNLIDIRSKQLQDRTIENDMLEDGSVMPTVIRFTNIFLMPLILIIIGLVIFFKRREKPATAGSNSRSSTSTEKEDKKS